jgi:hypothetical protein
MLLWTSSSKHGIAQLIPASRTPPLAITSAMSPLTAAHPEQCSRTRIPAARLTGIAPMIDNAGGSSTTLSLSPSRTGLERIHMETACTSSFFARSTFPSEREQTRRADGWPRPCTTTTPSQLCVRSAYVFCGGLIARLRATILCCCWRVCGCVPKLLVF